MVPAGLVLAGRVPHAVPGASHILAGIVPHDPQAHMHALAHVGRTRSARGPRMTHSICVVGALAGHIPHVVPGCARTFNFLVVIGLHRPCTLDAVCLWSRAWS